MKVTLTEPGVAGDYIVAEHNPDGSLLPAPDTSIAGIGKRIGGRPMGPEDFNHHFGHPMTATRCYAHRWTYSCWPPAKTR